MRCLVASHKGEPEENLVNTLRFEGHAVDASSGPQGIQEAVMVTDYDLIVVDCCAQPNASALIQELRSQSQETLLLALCPDGDQEAVLAHFDAGADDVQRGKTEIREFNARVRALLRRRPHPAVDIVEVGDLALDRDARVATLAGAKLRLTAREVSLLEYLMLNAGRIISRASIAEHVWDHRYEGRSNVIDVLVSRIRRKIRKAGSDCELATVRGLGWVLESVA